jgi:hypothetical protein
MYFANLMVDSIQDSKKFFVNTFVKDKELSNPLLKFVEAQTAFTKTALQSMHDYTVAMGNLSTNMYNVKKA